MSIVRKEVHLSRVNVEAFERHFPKTSLSWCLDLLLEKFVIQFNRTPEEYAEEAARALKDQL